MDEREVVEAVGRLVAAGEHRDELLLRPGASSEGTLGSLRTAQGDQPIVARGSPEHERARAAGELDPLPRLAPASPGAVEDAEARLGYRIPEPLRSLYLEVANGGFGPGYGVLGLQDGHHDSSGATALDLLDGHLWSAGPAASGHRCRARRVVRRRRRRHLVTTDRSRPPAAVASAGLRGGGRSGGGRVGSRRPGR